MYQIRTIVVTTIRLCNNRGRCNNSCMNFCAISAFITRAPLMLLSRTGLLSISIPLSIFIFSVVRVAEKTIDFSFLRFDSLLPVSWDYLVWNNFLKSKSFFKGSEEMKSLQVRRCTLDYVVNYVHHFCARSFYRVSVEMK